MPDGAVLARHVLVLKNNTRLGPIILGDIRASDEVHDLIRFDRAGARIHRIRPNAGEVINLERQDRAVAPDADLALAPMVASVDIGIEALDPVGDKLDRTI